MTYGFLLDIALILLSTKGLGLIVKKYQMPQVVGSLLAGLILGPAVFNVLHETEFLTLLAELGVIVIMFTAGMETDIRELKSSGKSGLIVAMVGVIVPLLMGAGLMYFFDEGVFAHSGSLLLRNFFVGVVLTATSVSITVETLKEIGKLNSKVGNTILAAAIIDDILGLVALTIITGLSGADVNISMVLIKIILFFIFAAVVSYALNRFFKWYANRVEDKDLHRFPIIAFVICLLMAYIAEHYFGVADIIGAFAAGLIIANTTKSKYIASKFSPLSYLLLTPIFFASIGIKVIIPEMTGMIIIFTILLVLVAIVSKLIGCGIGAKLSGYNSKESVQVGIGMVCRGEVVLIVVNKGVTMGLIDTILFGPVIIMVVLTALITPVLLKLVFNGDKGDFEQSDLVNNYEKVNQLDNIEQKLLEQK
ncbi:MAG: cation:proton antiporter [Haloplasmataceae bacterium]|jgi:Kef-type K+ transport system membrane component KefB|nr:cation:proton antiporter [Haloplasmataceae bacterium]